MKNRGGRKSLVSRAGGPRTQVTEPKDTLEVGKEHLDVFAVAARLLDASVLGEPRREHLHESCAGSCGSIAS